MKKYFSTFAAVMLSVVLGSAGIASAFNGHVFTSTSDGTLVNLNVYSSKDDVYINGGPQNVNSNGLPVGTYYFQVTTPNGDLLSTDNAVCRQVKVELVGGKGVIHGATGPCPHPNGTTNPTTGAIPIQLIPFDDTTNAGGEYKVWLIAQTAGTSIDGSDPKVIIFDKSDSKTDNFKVLPEDVPPGCEPDCPLPEGSTISGIKFYDANANGVLDDGEVGIPSWQIELYGDASNSTTTDSNGDFAFTNLDPGTYGVCEVIPENAPTWIPTTPTSISNLVVPPDSTDNQFGNVCLGAGGGLTLGFWSNKNGAKKLADGSGANPELDLLDTYCLVNAAGADQGNFGHNVGNFQKWLLKATATNMAYMLSAQTAAMVLNVEGGFVSGGSIVYAPGCGDTNLNSNGNFISITNLLLAAKTDLCTAGHNITIANVLPGSQFRAHQTCLKDALDDANNNNNFVQSSPCEVNYSNNEPSCVPQP